MAQLEIYTLGGSRFLLAGNAFEQLSTRKVEALAIYLAATRRPQPRELLADLLWDDRSQNRALSNLRVALSNLRKHLGPYVAITRNSASLNLDTEVWFDAHELESRLASFLKHVANNDQTSKDSFEQVEAALALYQGEFLQGFHIRGARGFEEWATVERERLNQLTIDGLGEVVTRHLEQGSYSAGIAHAQRWLQLDPLAEAAHQQMIRLLAFNGQPGAALKQYQECLRLLGQELGVPPSEATTSLYEAIQAGSLAPPEEASRSALTGLKWPPEPGEEPTPRDKDGPQPLVKLPLQATPFIGREEERSRLSTLLMKPTVKLITVLGPGGIGKTRLAIEAAKDQAQAFADGVYFVSLSSIDDPGFIASQISDALGLEFHARDHREHWEYDTQIKQLLAYLKEKQMLLILDNCEHLLTAELSSLPPWDRSIDALVAEIIETAPEVKILATSRERLNLHGETALSVDGLEYPTTEFKIIHAIDVSDFVTYSAIQLFVESARRLLPEFELKSEHQADMVDICRLVGGMPLGIELAAAWIELLTLAEIADEIRESLDFLATDKTNIPDRQRNIRSIFTSTWDRLTESEQQVFQQLSIFRGGFTRGAAQNITGASPLTLMGLVKKSLLRSDFKGRYQLHELLRQFAAELLAQESDAETAVRERHCNYFIAFLQQKEPALAGESQGETLKEIEIEIDNIRVAWQWAVAHDKYKEIEKAAESTCEYHRIRGRIDEGYRYFQPAAAALGWDGYGNPEDIRDGDTMFDDIMKLLDTPSTRVEKGNGRQLILGKVLARYSRLYCESPGRARSACQLRRESLELLSKFGERREMAWVLRYGAHVRLAPEQTKTLYQKALSIFDEIGDGRGRLETFYRLGALAAQLGEYQAAERLLQTSHTMAQEFGYPEIIIDCLVELGYVYWALGKYQKAGDFCRESIAISKELGYFSQVAYAQRCLARIAFCEIDLHEAEKHLRESLAIYESLGLQGLKAESLGELSHIEVDEGNFATASQLARKSLTLCQKLQYQAGIIEPHMVLGKVSLESSDFEIATGHFHTAVQTAVKVWRPSFALHSLVGLAQLHAAKDEKERAYELAIFVQHNSASWQWSKDNIAVLLPRLEADLSPKSIIAARKRGMEKELQQISEELRRGEDSANSPALR